MYFVNTANINQRIMFAEELELVYSLRRKQNTFDFCDLSKTYYCHALLQGSSQYRDQTQISCIAVGFFTV